MRKSLSALMAIILAALVVAGLVVASRDNDKAEPVSSATEQQESDTSKSPAAEVSAVDIENFSFSPTDITVKKGTTVTWTNKDSAIHTVTPDTEVGEFGSGELSKGETYSYTFDTVGTFSYHCQPHPDMKGTVVVTE